MDNVEELQDAEDIYNVYNINNNYDVDNIIDDINNIDNVIPRGKHCAAVLKHEFGSCFPGSTGGTGIRELSTVLKLYPTMPVMRYIANLALSALFWDMARHGQGAISGNLTSQNICRYFNGQFTKSWAVIGQRQHGPLIG